MHLYGAFIKLLTILNLFLHLFKHKPHRKYVFECNFFSQKQCNRYSDWLRTVRSMDRCSSPGRVKNFVFSMSSRPVLGHTQPGVRRVPGFFFRRRPYALRPYSRLPRPTGIFHTLDQVLMYLRSGFASGDNKKICSEKCGRECTELKLK
jgi:hypothetical protein